MRGYWLCGVRGLFFLFLEVLMRVGVGGGGGESSRLWLCFKEVCNMFRVIR